MNKLHFCRADVLLSATLLLLPFSSHSSEFAVQPRVNLGVTFYEFEQEAGFAIVPNGDPATRFDIFGPSGSRSLGDTMPFIGLGATLFRDKFFVDVYAQRAMNGDDTGTQDQFPPLIRDRDDASFDREEYSISIGYAVVENLALYAGYRETSTEFDIDTERTIIGITPADDIVTFEVTELDYEQNGFFVGGNYGWPISNKGALALNLGVAFIDGKVKEDFGETTGETVGITLGMSWTGPLPVENLNYTVGIDGYRYDFEADEDAGLDFSETVIRVSAGVAYTI